LFYRDPGRSFDLTLISHHTRYNDLRKYCAILDLESEEKIRFTRIHPTICLGLRKGLKNFPPDLSLEPKDVLAMYNSVSATKVDTDIPSLKAFFGEKRLIARGEVRDYEGLKPLSSFQLILICPQKPR